MLLFAGAPAFSLSAKLLVGCFIFVLGVLLVRAIHAGPFSFSSAAVSGLSCLVAIVVVHLGVSRPAFRGLDDTGIISGTIALWCASWLLPIQHSASRWSRPHTVRLAGVAAISGPMCGLVLAVLELWLFDVPRMDRAHNFRVYALVGAIAGGVVAVALAIISQRKGESPSPPSNSRSATISSNLAYPD